MVSRVFLVSGLTAVAAAAQSQIPVVSLADGAKCGCTQLSATYGNLTLFDNSTDYSTEIINFWDIRSDLSPHCIFQPETAAQVADAVKIFSSCGTQFAIRGGGHMNYPGANNINGGVLLTLNGLAETKVDEKASTIEVGPGCKWVDVYGALAPYGLYTIGGRMKTIGVPGLSLIGGFHYLINKYGYTMDNILGYEVVLGNGTQVTANAKSNPELFWSLKGGANNFGVVTKFLFKAYHIPQVSTSIHIYNESAITDFIQATVDLNNNNGPEIGAGAFITISYNATTKAVSATFFGVQEGTESPPSRFAGFAKIPSVSTIHNVTTPKQWHSQLETPNQMFRIQFGHHTMKPDAKQVNRIYQGWKKAVDSLSDVQGLQPTLALNIMPKSSMSVAKHNGIGNTWGLDDCDNLLIWQFATGWANADDDLRVTNWAKSLLEYWHEDTKARGLASEFLYMGDSGEFQDPFSSYPVANVNRLLKARANYDPLGVFSRLNWGGFKLPA